MLAYDYPLLGIFWSFMLLFMFVMVGFVVIYTFIDNFRRSDHSGLAKAGWALFIIVLPLLGALIYIVARPEMRDPRCGRPCDLRTPPRHPEHGILVIAAVSRGRRKTVEIADDAVVRRRCRVARPLPCGAARRVPGVPDDGNVAAAHLAQQWSHHLAVRAEHAFETRRGRDGRALVRASPSAASSSESRWSARVLRRGSSVCHTSKRGTAHEAPNRARSQRVGQPDGVRRRRRASEEVRSCHCRLLIARAWRTMTTSIAMTIKRGHRSLRARRRPDAEVSHGHGTIRGTGSAARGRRTTPWVRGHE